MPEHVLHRAPVARVLVGKRRRRMPQRMIPPPRPLAPGLAQIASARRRKKATRRVFAGAPCRAPLAPSGQARSARYYAYDNANSGTHLQGPRWRRLAQRAPHGQGALPGRVRCPTCGFERGQGLA